MLLLKFIAIILACYCCLPASNARGNNADCETLQARCRICVRSIREGTDEDNMLGRLNRDCQVQVGRIYAWRNLDRCDITHIRCKGLNEKLSCTAIGKLAGMPRRLK